MNDFLSSKDTTTRSEAKLGGTKDGGSTDARNAARRALQYIDRAIITGQEVDDAWVKAAIAAVKATATLYGITTTSHATNKGEANETTINTFKADARSTLNALEACATKNGARIQAAKARKAKAASKAKGKASTRKV